MSREELLSVKQAAMGLVLFETIVDLLPTGALNKTKQRPLFSATFFPVFAGNVPDMWGSSGT